MKKKLEIVPAAKALPVATLKSGDDKSTAKQLNKLFSDAQNGMRKIVALGLFAWEIKENQLKHGEFGPWLAQHCPKLATIDSVTGKAKTSRALNGYMELTKNVLEACGIPTIEKYLGGVAKFANDANLGHGKFLLIADKKVPDALKEVRENICALVDGKTQRALFTEFKQAEEDDSGTAKKKHGRIKGKGGATAEQRERAAMLEAEEKIEALKLEVLRISERLMILSDDDGLGEILGTPELDALDKAMQTARGFIRNTGGE